MMKTPFLVYLLALSIFCLSSACTVSSNYSEAPAVETPTTPAVNGTAATSLTWTTSTPSYVLSVSPTWSLASGNAFASQSIQYYSDTACTTPSGAPVTLSASATTDNFIGSDLTSYSFKVTSTTSSGAALVSACSSSMALNTSACVGARLTNSPYAGGTGTTLDPYLICTGAQMNAIGLTSSDWSKTFKLLADISLAAYTGTQYNIIGNATTKFTGVFDGNSHTISNLSITRSSPDEIGLIGYMNGGATVKDLTLSSVTLSVANDSVNLGSVVGRISTGTVSNCHVTSGTVTQTLAPASAGIGGLVGRATTGTITNLSSALTFLSTHKSVYAGGIIGRADTTTAISGSSYTGVFQLGADANFAGGIAANLASSSITSSYSTGTIRGANGISVVGGLVGLTSGTASITKSYFSGSVIAFGTDIGGLVGKLASTTGYGVTDSYASGDVTGSYASGFVGGLIGTVQGNPSITNTYASGTITANSTKGGLVGQDNNSGPNYGIYTANFWNSGLNGSFQGIGSGPVPAGISGASVATLQDPATFSAAGWTSPNWNLTTSGMYLKLGWQP